MQGELRRGTPSCPVGTNCFRVLETEEAREVEGGTVAPHTREPAALKQALTRLVLEKPSEKRIPCLQENPRPLGRNVAACKPERGLTSGAGCLEP